MQSSIFKRFAAAIALYWGLGCNSVFYQGDSVSGIRPEKIHLNCGQEKIRSDDGTGLATMHCPANVNPPKAVVIQFHGNAQNMYAHYRFLAWMLKDGFSLATFDYRGYGDSEGESDREGIYRDARAYIRHTRTVFDAYPRIYYGQSLGGIILMRALLDEGLRSDEIYIFEGTFASYQGAARTALAGKWFLWPLQWLACVLVTDNLAVEKDIGVFAGQNIILIHGSEDPVVSPRHGKFLAEKMQQPLWLIAGGGHLDTWHREKGKLRSELIQKLGVSLSRLRHR